MRAAYATKADPENPLQALVTGDLQEQAPPDGWLPVTVRASSLNHHDLWSLRGVGLPGDRLPMVLGCDAAGVTEDGDEVVVYSVVPDAEDPRGLSLLSEHYPGTLADRVFVPRENVIPKPAGLSFAEAACLPTAWLTAWNMLTTLGRVDDAEAVLVQGAGGGVATAAVVLGVAMDKRVYATSREEWKRERVTALGATALEPGARLPERVGVVIESVGAPTLEHSMKSSAPEARIVVCGATGGHRATVDLRRVFAMRLDILGATMGSADDMRALIDFLDEKDVRPVIDSIYGFSAVRDAFEHLETGEVFGKVVVDHLH
jgi:NADPH:quinone reductase-like Zn-dependent oxidoreductase